MIAVVRVEKKMAPSDGDADDAQQEAEISVLISQLSADSIGSDS